MKKQEKCSKCQHEGDASNFYLSKKGKPLCAFCYAFPKGIKIIS